MKTETPNKTSGNCCDSKLVKVAGNKLTSTSAEGEENTYTLAEDAKVTCNGKVSKATEIKAGSTIRMTMCNDDKNKVNAIDCGKHIPDLAMSKA